MVNRKREIWIKDVLSLLIRDLIEKGIIDEEEFQGKLDKLSELKE